MPIRVLMAAALLTMPAAALAADSASPRATVAAAANADGDQKICKKRLEVGSLVRKKKECWTKAEWERIAEMEQKGAKRTQDELMGGMSCDPNVQPC